MSWECSIIENLFRNHLRPIGRLYGFKLLSKSAKSIFKILLALATAGRHAGTLSSTKMSSQTLPLKQNIKAVFFTCLIQVIILWVFCLLSTVVSTPYCSSVYSTRFFSTAFECTLWKIRRFTSFENLLNFIVWKKTLQFNELFNCLYHRSYKKHFEVINNCSKWWTFCSNLRTLAPPYEHLFFFLQIFGRLFKQLSNFKNICSTIRTFDRL